MYLKEIVLEGVDWIDVAEHKGKWQPHVNSNERLYVTV